MNKVENVTVKPNEKINDERPPVQVVKSIGIAHVLTEHFFNDLLSIRNDKFNEGRSVWFFRRSKEFDNEFNSLIEQHKSFNNKNKFQPGE